LNELAGPAALKPGRPLITTAQTALSRDLSLSLSLACSCTACSSSTSLHEIVDARAISPLKIDISDTLVLAPEKSSHSFFVHIAPKVMMSTTGSSKVMIVCLSVMLIVSLAGASSAEVKYVHVGGVTGWTNQLPLLVCSGLFNRAAETPVYTFQGGLTPADEDVAWLKNVENVSTVPPLTNATEFLSSCLAGPAGGRYISYNSTDRKQQANLPSIVTLAGVLDAVPLDIASGALPAGATTVAFDAVSVFAGLSPREVAEYYV